MVSKIGIYSTVLIKLCHSTVNQIDKSNFAARDRFLQLSNVRFNCGGLLLLKLYVL